MFSKTDIANFALGHIGNSRLIENLDEATQEAMTCKLYMDLVLKKVARDGNWSFLNVYEPMQLVVNKPNTDWLFAYQYPSDCEIFERVVGAARVEPVNYPFEIGRYDQSKVIFANQAEAIGVYRRDINYVQQFDQDFAEVSSYFLATKIAMPLSVDKQILAAVTEQYRMAMSMANANSMNESQLPEVPESSFFIAREGY